MRVRLSHVALIAGQTAPLPAVTEAATPAAGTGKAPTSAGVESCPSEKR